MAAGICTYAVVFVYLGGVGLVSVGEGMHACMRWTLRFLRRNSNKAMYHSSGRGDSADKRRSGWPQRSRWV